MNIGLLANGMINIGSQVFRIYQIDPKDISKEQLMQLAHASKFILDERRYPIPNKSEEQIAFELLNPSYVDYEILYYMIYSNEILVGISSIDYETGEKNRNFATVWIHILPNYRDIGIEKEVARFMHQSMPDEVDTINFVNRRGSSMNKFYQDLLPAGAKLSYGSRVSGSNVQEYDRQIIDAQAEKLQKDAYDRGYDLIYVENAKFQETLGKNYLIFIKLVETIWNDMPREDASWDDEVVSPELFESMYKNVEALNNTVFTYIAMHRESGLPVGYTEILIHGSNPRVANQGDTGVLKEHRGNRLGATLKYTLLSKMLGDPRCQEVEYWVTSNAGTNDPMLRINEELNYKELFFSDSYEIPREAYEKVLNFE